MKMLLLWMLLPGKWLKMAHNELDDFMAAVVSKLEEYEGRIADLEKIEALTLPFWDDIQVSISQLRIPPSQAPTWRNWNYGVSAGVNYSVLGFDDNEYVDLFIQSSHAMKLSTALDYHVHWSLPSNSSGDRIRFQVDVIAAGIEGTFAVPTGSPFVVEYILDGTESGKHKLLDLAAVPGVNTTVSTAYIMKLTRLVATANNYAPEVYVFFTDGHYQGDDLGSRLEDSK